MQNFFVIFFPHLGRWGPGLVQKARPDLTERFPYQDTTVADYLYHLIVQEPSGKQARITLGSKKTVYSSNFIIIISLDIGFFFIIIYLTFFCNFYLR